MENIQNIIITKEFNKKRLDKAIVSLIEGFSRERIKTLIEKGCVTKADGSTVLNAASKVWEGDSFFLAQPENETLDIAAEDIPLDILFEDEHLIIVNKPAGMSVHPAGPIVTGTLVNALMHHCTDLSGIGGVERPGIVHRLDKGTSGVMVVAKHDRAHTKLSQMFADRTMERNYLALVFGCPLSKDRRIETLMGRSTRDRKKMAVVESGGKEAITTFQILENFDSEASLLKFKLFTGRTHQIRVHTSHIGHGILGDPMYGRAKKLPSKVATTLLKQVNHQMLHATILGFNHPITGEVLRFEKEMPQDMQEIYDALKRRA